MRFITLSRMKKYIIVGVIVVLCGVGVYSLRNKISGIPGEVCNQAATTTDCAKITETQKVAAESNKIESQKVVMKNYSNDELGFSFSYPALESEVSNLRMQVGDTGRVFGGEVAAVPALRLYVHALTADFTLGTEASPGMAEGYVVKDGKYYSIVKGKRSQLSFTPDEIWKSKSGTDIAVMLNYKNHNPEDFYPPLIQATVNLPYANDFTGVAFVMTQKYENNAYVPFTDDEIALFKKIVTSVELVKN